MTQEVKDFITGYNKAMEWNKDILNGFDANLTKDFIGEYLPTEKIVEEDYELDNAKIYSYDDEGLFEMQVYSLKIYHGVYFWLKCNETEEEYKKRKTELVVQRISEKVNGLTAEIDRLTAERGEFLKIKEAIL